jgi:hypothetical protein
VLHDVAHPCAADQTGQEAATVAHTAMVFDQAGQPSVDAVIETINFVGGVVFHLAQVDERFDDGAVSPDIGPTQVVHAQDLNVFEGHKLAEVLSGGLVWLKQGESRGHHSDLRGCGDTIICIRAGVQQSLGSCFYFYRRPSIDIG